MQLTTVEDAPFIDLSDPSLSVRSQAIKDVRKDSWFARTPYGLAVLRYADMRNLLLHRGLRQGSHEWPAHNNVTGVFSDWWSRTILVQEGANHERLRRLVNPAFAPAIIRAMKPDFEVMAQELVDTFAHLGKCDFMKDFADPYASLVICHVLGLPRQESPQILKLSATMGLALGLSFKENEQRINEATLGMYAYADDLIADRKNTPGDDFMSTLVAASEADDGLTHDELRDMILMLVFAGIDTTRNQLGLGMATFLDHPDQWELLADQPELAPQAVEEVMRVRPTITWVTRQAITDIEYNGLVIKEGTTLHLLAEAAGTDQEVYDENFDITVTRKRHFGFGGGMHHCLGHAIARSDMAIALTVLPTRIKNIRPAGTGTWLPDSGNTGAISLPITFDPVPQAS